MGHSAVEIHSNRSLAQRRAALAGFKNGQYRIMVATEIAARGIDVDDISLVINYDLPDNADDYVIASVAPVAPAVRARLSLLRLQTKEWLSNKLKDLSKKLLR